MARVKPAIYWALCQAYEGGLTRLIAVTSRLATGRIYGRDERGKLVNVPAPSVLAFYPTQDAALSAMRRAESARAGFFGRIEEARGWVKSLEREEKRAVQLAYAPDRVVP